MFSMWEESPEMGRVRQVTFTVALGDMPLAPKSADCIQVQRGVLHVFGGTPTFVMQTEQVRRTPAGAAQRTASLPCTGSLTRCAGLGGVEPRGSRVAWAMHTLTFPIPPDPSPFYRPALPPLAPPTLTLNP